MSRFVVHHGIVSSKIWFSKEKHRFSKCVSKCVHRNHILVQVHLKRFWHIPNCWIYMFCVCVCVLFVFVCLKQRYDFVNILRRHRYRYRLKRFGQLKPVLERQRCLTYPWSAPLVYYDMLWYVMLCYVMCVVCGSSVSELLL